eukprot:SAG11_NODE_4013_length_2107_cov_90.408367_2_plen_128_part_00
MPGRGGKQLHHMALITTRDKAITRSLALRKMEGLEVKEVPRAPLSSRAQRAHMDREKREATRELATRTETREVSAKQYAVSKARKRERDSAAAKHKAEWGKQLQVRAVKTTGDKGRQRGEPILNGLD